jgi:hypothetical protein
LVTTAQLYVPGRQDKEQLATEGVEGGGTVRLIVTGGAGNVAGCASEQRQTFLGFNSRGGVNLLVTFTRRPPTTVGAGLVPSSRGGSQSAMPIQ